MPDHINWQSNRHCMAPRHQDEQIVSETSRGGDDGSWLRFFLLMFRASCLIYYSMRKYYDNFFFSHLIEWPYEFLMLWRIIMTTEAFCRFPSHMYLRKSRRSDSTSECKWHLIQTIPWAYFSQVLPDCLEDHEEEMCQTIMHSPNKHCPLDPAPTWFKKGDLDPLLSLITYPNNHPLWMESCHPSSRLPRWSLGWRSHCLTPLWWPATVQMSNRPFPSKVLERVVNVQHSHYLNDNNLGERLQQLRAALHKDSPDVHAAGHSQSCKWAESGLSGHSWPVLMHHLTRWIMTTWGYE